MEHQPSGLSAEALRLELLRGYQNVHLIEVASVRTAVLGRPSTEVWEGVVHVFETEGASHEKQSVYGKPGIIYVWSSIVGDTNRRRFYAVPQQDSANTAEEAVRKAMSRGCAGCGHWTHDRNM